MTCAVLCIWHTLKVSSYLQMQCAAVLSLNSRSATNRVQEGHLFGKITTKWKKNQNKENHRNTFLCPSLNWKWRKETNLFLPWSRDINSQTPNWNIQKLQMQKSIFCLKHSFACNIYKHLLLTSNTSQTLLELLRLLRRIKIANTPKV